MINTVKIPRYILIYAWFLTIFTAAMVFMSLFNSIDFFKSYGVTADRAFQISWSFRYLVVLSIMLLGLIFRNQQSLLFTVFARFLIDVFDGIAVGIYNTPPFSFGWLAFHICVLLGPQLFCIIKLFQLNRNSNI